jgi:WD40 repeat protein
MDWKYSALYGHKAAVNSLTSLALGPQLFASCSDDKSVRIWDTRTKKSVKCIVEVFTYGVTDIISIKDTLYCASGNTVYGFDLRTDNVLIKRYVDVDTFDIESISTMSSHPSGDYYAVADENGNIYLSYTLTKQRRQISSKKGHLSDISSIAFDPRSMYYMASCGYDYRLLLWDTGANNPRGDVNFAQATKGAPQVLLPPFVFKCDYVCGGHLIAAAIGNGNVTNHHKV